MVKLVYTKKRGADKVALGYKIDVLAKLKEAGYSTDKLRRTGLLSESVIQHLRTGDSISWASLERVCSLLNAEPGDILEYNGSPNSADVKKIVDQNQAGREFSYLWWIWDTEYRKEGQSITDFHREDYAHFLPVPDDWSMPTA